MSHWHLERAIYLLGHDGPLTARHEKPGAALDELVENTKRENEADETYQYPPFRLDADEVKLIAEADIARMYKGGVHPNLIRAFAGTWGLNYVAEYRAAGL